MNARSAALQRGGLSTFAMPAQAIRAALACPPRKPVRFWLAGAVLLLGGCGVAVTVENRSARPLADLTISGKGFVQQAGTLPAGSARTVYVHPHGESGVTVSFTADGRRYSAGNGYIEDDFMYRVIVTVGADLSIDIDTNLR